MAKLWNRVLKIFLSAILVISFMPSVAIADDSEEFASGSYRYTLSANKATITAYEGSEANVLVPSEINGYHVVAIAEYAFAGTSIESLFIPEGVVSIGANTFEGCTELASIDLPSTLSAIDGNPFAGCNSLVTLSVDEGNERYSSDEQPLLYDKEKAIVIAAGAVVSAEVPSTVVRIGPNAFSYCRSLTDISIPSSVASLGDCAFLFCDSLTTIVVPESVAEIGEGAFMDCRSLKDAKILAENVSVGRFAFKGFARPCDITVASQELYSLLTGENATTYLSTSGEYNILLSSKSEAPEENIVSQSGFTYNVENGEAIVTGYKGSSSAISIPTEINGCPVTTIGENAFYGCSIIESVVIPEGVTSIADNAFANCEKMKDVSFPSSLRRIGIGAFGGCTSLMEVDIPYGVGFLGDYAFAECSSLKNVSIPGTVTEMGAYTFLRCDALEAAEIGEGVSCLPSGMFSDTALSRIALPSTLTEIGDWAFRGCLFTNFSIPESVAVIGSGIFKDSKLENLVIPASVSTIKLGAFVGLSDPSTIAVSTQEQYDLLTGDDASNYLSTDRTMVEFDVFTYELDSSGKATITGYYGAGGDLVIPSNIDSHPVTAIGFEAFKHNTDIQRVYISEGIVSIGEAAFAGCTNLVEVSLPDTLILLGSSSFGGTALISVVIPASVETISFGVFSDCAMLSSVTIEEGVREIKSEAFGGCSSLTSIHLPQTISTVEGFAFSWCPLLQSITVAVGNQYYDDNDGVLLTADGATLVLYPQAKPGSAYQIPASVTTIGDRAFFADSRYPSVKEVIIPEGVHTIEYYAFEGCTSLSNVSIPSSVALIKTGAFLGLANSSTIIVSTQDQYDLLNGNADYISVDRTTVELNVFETESVIVETPIIATDLVYTGAELIGVAPGEGYTVDGGTGVNAGNYVAVVKLADNYVWADGSTDSKELEWTIDAADIADASSALLATSCTYTGAPLKPAALVTLDGTRLVEDEDYVIAYARNVDVGTAIAVVVGLGNYTGTKVHTFEIDPLSVADASVSKSLSTASYTYDGTARTPSVTVKHGSTTLTKDVDYTVSYASGRKNVGSYKVTVKGKGNYAGTATLTFKIDPLSVASSSVTKSLSATSYTYNGSARKPSVTVKLGSAKLVSGTDYTVAYPSGRKNVGSYKVTVKGKGNYTGTATLTFKINPKATKVSSLTALDNGFKVKWSKVSSQCTGYQIRYSTSSSMSGAKTKTVSSYKTTSKSVTKLKNKKTYYVQVRTYKTVDGVKYYSSWSSVKKVKTK